jgi:hypothetical protein
MSFCARLISTLNVQAFPRKEAKYSHSSAPEISERPCGLEIDCQLVLDRLHWKISRLLAPQDAIDVTGRTPELVKEIGSVGDQAASGGEEASGVDGGQLMPGRERDDQVAMTQRQWTPRHDQGFMGRPHECSDGRFDLAGTVPATVGVGGAKSPELAAYMPMGLCDE